MSWSDSLFPVATIEKMRQVHDASDTSFTYLVEVAGLDPREDFRDADLRTIDIRGADLSMFDFSNSDLDGAILDDKTILPNDNAMAGVVGVYVNVDRAKRLQDLVTAEVFWEETNRYRNVYAAVEALEHDSDFSEGEINYLANYLLHSPVPMKTGDPMLFTRLANIVYRDVHRRDPNDDRLRDLFYHLQDDPEDVIRNVDT